MRTASMVLGIVGGVLALLFAIIYLISGAFVSGSANIIDDYTNFNNGEFSDDFFDSYDDGTFSYEFDVNPGAIVDYGIQAAAVWLWISGVLSIIGGVLGIIGGAQVKKKNVMAGVFMLVGGVLSVFTGVGFISMVVLVVGGILALVKEKPAQAAYPYPYSGYSQQAPPPPPYNPYQQQPQQPYNPYQPPQQPYNPYQAPQAPPAPPAPPQEPEAPKSEE